MGVEALLSRLEAAAREEADAILAGARREAAEIRREAEREARAREERWLEQRERELRSEAEARVAEARRQARRQVLEARGDLLDRVRREAARRLETDEAVEACARDIGARLSDALAYLGERDAVVRCRPALAREISGDLRATRAPGGPPPHRTPSVEIEADPDAPVGFLVRAADGSLVVDDTLAERLRRSWGGLAVEVVRAVEAEGPDEDGGGRAPEGEPAGDGTP